VLTHFFSGWKEHIGGFVSVSRRAPSRARTRLAALLDVEGAVGLRYVVRAGISEKAGGAVDGRWAALELQECADWSLVELNFQVAKAWESVGGPEFFIAEQWTQAQGGQDSVHLLGVGNGDFDFLSDFVAALISSCADCGSDMGRGLERSLEGENGLGGPGTALPMVGRAWLLDSDANELAAACQAFLGSVIESVGFVGARGDLSGAELVEATAQRGDVCYAELDFNFLIGFGFRHDGKCYGL
jgi:hypothetical protein